MHVLTCTAVSRMHCIIRTRSPQHTHAPHAGVSDADPYWTRAWPSAVALASQILKRPELVRGKVRVSRVEGSAPG